MIVVTLSRTQAPVRLHVDVGSRFPALISATGRCVAAFSEHPWGEIEKRFRSLRWQNAPDYESWRKEIGGYATPRLQHRPRQLHCRRGDRCGAGAEHAPYDHAHHRGGRAGRLARSRDIGQAGARHACGGGNGGGAAGFVITPRFRGFRDGEMPA
jgi:hypothetical protein